MKNIFLLSAIVILSACASPQVTVTSKMTVTSTPAPTLTPTPVAIDGVAQDNEGNYLVYQEESQTWVILPELGGEFDRIVVNDDGSIVAMDKNGIEIYSLSVAGEWEVVEKVYASCADPELIQKKKDDFKSIIGTSIDEYIQQLIDAGAYKVQEFFFPRTEQTIYENIVFVGSAEVSLENMGTFSPEDRAFCVYLADDSDPSTLIPVVLGFTHNSEFYQTLGFLDKSTDVINPLFPTTADDLKSWWDKHGPAEGDLLELYYWDFVGIVDPKEVANVDNARLTFGPNVAKFIELTGTII